MPFIELLEGPRQLDKGYLLVYLQATHAVIRCGCGIVVCLNVETENVYVRLCMYQHNFPHILINPSA